VHPIINYCGQVKWMHIWRRSLKCEEILFRLTKKIVKRQCTITNMKSLLNYNYSVIAQPYATNCTTTFCLSSLSLKFHIHSNDNTKQTHNTPMDCSYEFTVVSHIFSNRSGNIGESHVHDVLIYRYI